MDLDVLVEIMIKEHDAEERNEKHHCSTKLWNNTIMQFLLLIRHKNYCIAGFRKIWDFCAHQTLKRK